MTTKTRAASPKRLTRLSADLRARGFEPPDYRYLREAAVNGVIRAHQVNNIWHYDPEDLANIEKALRQAAASSVSA
jgi:hypothetical protein